MSRREEIFLLTFSDFWAAIKKARYKIFFFSALFATLAFCYAVTRPVEYLVQATFKEKGTKESGMGGPSLPSIFLGGNEQVRTEAISVMKSNRLLQELIQKHHIQGTLTKEELRFPLFKTVINNLKSEYAHLRNRLAPALRDPIEEVEISVLTYPGEVPKNFTLKFKENGNFAVLDKDLNFIGDGHLGNPFEHEEAMFVLDARDPSILEGETYTLAIRAIPKVVTELMGRLNIEADPLSKSILKLTYSYPDRHLACQHLNTLMENYQDFLSKEHQRISKEQISYLEKRHQTMDLSLKKMMEDYADRISTDVSETGFMNTEDGMRFFAEALQRHKQRLLEINLEIERLERAQSNQVVFFDRHGSVDPQVINAILSEIRILKQECDGLNLVIRQASQCHEKEKRDLFLEQIQQLEKVQADSQEAKVILAHLEENQLDSIKIVNLNKPDYFVNLWMTKLSEAKSDQEISACKTNLNSYLHQLIHFFDVKEQSLHERISRQQIPQEQFQGISQPIANSLYVQYSTEKGNAETLLRQKDYVLAQLENEEFEISSLSSLLTDSVSRQMIDRASALALALQDQSNRSTKEQERLREELNVQKKFLRSHLKQSQQLGELQIQLLKDKILALQNVSLELNQQKISILQTHLSDFLQNRLENLQEENDVVYQQLKELQAQLRQMPTQWISEKIINEKMASNHKMVEELTRLVESKNIASNLEIIQSAPLDIAKPPLHPRAPRLILLTFLGAILGLMFGMGKEVYHCITQGVLASEDNLTASGFAVAGKFSKHFQDRNPAIQSQEDREVLRRIASFITGDAQIKPSHARVILLLEGNRTEYCRSLATLMSKAGLKVLLVPVTQVPGSFAQDPGLFPFLEGFGQEPAVIKGSTFDLVSAGASSGYEAELLTSSQFQRYLNPLIERYDYIFVISQDIPPSAAADLLLKHFKTAVLSISQETVDELREVCHAALDTSNFKRLFVFV